MASVDVLVVDDEVSVAESTAQILRSAGFTTMIAHDVQGSLDLASAHLFKVFVLDHVLGHDTCEPILEQTEHLPSVVVVSSSHPDDVERVTRHHKKVLSVKTKPCDPVDLIETVRKAICG